MSGIDGFNSFTERYLFDVAYLDGTTVDQLPVQVGSAQGLTALPTHGGTHVMASPYLGSDAADAYCAYTFGLTAIAAKQLGWYALKRAYSKGAPFYFGTGLRVVETFTATSGSAYRLSRPLAAGVVPGVTSGSGSGTHPYNILLAGVSSPSSASASGQVLTAAATGVISIEYTPVHVVYFTTFNESIPENNHAELAIVMEEVLGS